MAKNILHTVMVAMIVTSFTLLNSACSTSVSNQKIMTIGGDVPRTGNHFRNDPDNFQFVIVGDRTGNHRPGVFRQAMDQINLLQPEFVMSVGDLIEGYTEDESLLSTEWDELESIVGNLDMPFFYTVGNHDLSNSVMQSIWRKRLGRDYYHFVYKDVLFISLNTEDPPIRHKDDIRARQAKLDELWRKDPAGTQAMILERSRARGSLPPLPSEVSISDAQVEYVADALSENSDVRWTMLFMHKPAWKGDNAQFLRIEALVQDRPYTMIAGHEHYYSYQSRLGRDYIDMGTTGGIWLQDGPGKLDHVAWVTMSEDGPIFANISLDGLTGKEGAESP